MADSTPNLNNNWMNTVICWSRYGTCWVTLSLVGVRIPDLDRHFDDKKTVKIISVAFYVRSYHITIAHLKMNRVSLVSTAYANHRRTNCSGIFSRWIDEVRPKSPPCHVNLGSVYEAWRCKHGNRKNRKTFNLITLSIIFIRLRYSAVIKYILNIQLSW